MRWVLPKPRGQLYVKLSYPAARVIRKDSSHTRAVVLRFAEDGDQIWQPVEKVTAWIEVCCYGFLHTPSPHTPRALSHVAGFWTACMCCCSGELRQDYVSGQIQPSKSVRWPNCCNMFLCRQCKQRVWMRTLPTPSGMQRKHMQQPHWQASAAARVTGMPWILQPSAHAPLSQVHLRSIPHAVHCRRQRWCTSQLQVPSLRQLMSAGLC